MSSRTAPTASAGTSSAPAPRRLPRRSRARWLWLASREVVVPALVLVALGFVWEAAVAAFKIPVFMLPAPSAIWAETSAIAGQIGIHTLATLKTVMIGFAISVAISLPLAVLVTSSPVVSNAIYPILVLTNSIPKVALAPILVVALGAKELPGIVVTFLVAFFPLVISVAAGILSTPQELLDLGRFYRASKLDELYRIRFPYSIPFIFSGLKVAISLAVVGAVVGEFVVGDRGLGHLIVASTAFFKTSVAFGAMGILSLMGIVLFQAIVVIERTFFPWSQTEETAAL